MDNTKLNIHQLKIDKANLEIEISRLIREFEDKHQVKTENLVKYESLTPMTHKIIGHRNFNTQNPTDSYDEKDYKQHDFDIDISIKYPFQI